MTPTVPDLPQAEIAIIELTNAFRQENRRGVVVPNSELTRAARDYAEFLAKSEIFSHTADGRQPADRITAAGYTYCLVSENLALNLDTRGFLTRQLATDAVEGWKSSPGHRINMLAEHVTEIGVGIAKARGEEKYLSVQLFGRPDSLKYKFQVTNSSNGAVRYSWGGERQEIAPRMAITHTACMPGEVEFERTAGPGARAAGARYRTRSGDLFVLKPEREGGVRVEHQPSKAR
jgi:hypothetical protein